MKEKDHYVPPADGGTFAVRTMKAMGGAMSHIQIQKGHEKKQHLPALMKLIMVLAAVLLVAFLKQPLALLTLTALVLVQLCTWPGRDILNILKTGFVAAGLAFLLSFPAMVLHPQAAGNQLRVVWKVLLSVTMVAIFNHTTQWNHITAALRKLHVPGIFIFILDITLKFVVLLGNLICNLLTAMQLRSVGKNNRKYDSTGGIMGVTFYRGVRMSTQMYEAMRCRGFTDDYKGL